MTLEALRVLYAEVRRLEDARYTLPSNLTNSAHWSAIRNSLDAKDKLPAAVARFGEAAMVYVIQLLEQPSKESS